MPKELTRNNRVYGMHELIGDNGDAFFDQTPDDQALDQGWSSGCPIALRLTKSIENGGRGAKAMKKRYGEVNFWFGQVVYTLQEKDRPDLVDELTLAMYRTSSEPLGEHDANWTPDLLQTRQLVTTAGFALPRLITSFINQSNTSIENKQYQTILAIEALELATEDSYDVNEFLVNFANTLINLGLDPKFALKTILSQGKLDEDNCKNKFSDIFRIISLTSPTLYRTYMSFTEKEHQQLGVAKV